VSRQQDGLWCCPEPGCVRVYVKQAWLTKHLADGEHSIPVRSSLTQRAADFAASILYDSFEASAVRGKYQVRHRNVPTINISTTVPVVVKGWALTPWCKPVQRKTLRVKKWPTDLFEIGEQSRRKTKPAEAESQMKSLRSDSGGLLFKVEERLSKSQIQSWFSAYAKGENGSTERGCKCSEAGSRQRQPGWKKKEIQIIIIIISQRRHICFTPK